MQDINRGTKMILLHKISSYYKEGERTAMRITVISIYLLINYSLKSLLCMVHCGYIGEPMWSKALPSWPYNLDRNNKQDK